MKAQISIIAVTNYLRITPNWRQAHECLSAWITPIGVEKKQLSYSVHQKLCCYCLLACALLQQGK